MQVLGVRGQVLGVRGYCHVLKLVYSYFVSLSDIYLFKKLSL